MPTLKIRQQLVTNLAKTNGKGNRPTTLTIHQTDNFSPGANAAAHANLQSRLGAKVASWHWQVDDKEAVQSYAEDVKCWHAGDGSTGPGNNASIAIEMCVNPDSNYAQTLDNGAQLAAQILTRHGLPVSAMVQHNYWTGKNCPSQVRSRGEWAQFVALVTHYMDPTPTKKEEEPEMQIVTLKDSATQYLLGSDGTMIPLPSIEYARVANKMVSRTCSGINARERDILLHITSLMKAARK